MIGEVPPKLDKAGAGLPFFENLFARYFILPYYTSKSTWDESNSHFLKHGQKILESIEGLSREQMDKAILIPRLKGLEDSSRYWSIAETLEHLIIVGTGMANIIVELSHNRVPPVKVDVAKVKPKKELSADVARDQFRNFLDFTYKRLRTDVLNRESKAQLLHPWFGLKTAKEWNWIVASHQFIHRKQIELIKSNLLNPESM